MPPMASIPTTEAGVAIAAPATLELEPLSSLSEAELASEDCTSDAEFIDVEVELVAEVVEEVISVASKLVEVVVPLPELPKVFAVVAGLAPLLAAELTCVSGVALPWEQLDGLLVPTFKSLFASPTQQTSPERS